MRIIFYKSGLYVDKNAADTIHCNVLCEAFLTNGHEVLKCGNWTESVESSDAIRHRVAIYSLLKRIMPSSVAKTIRDIYVERNQQASKQRLLELICKEKPDFVYERYYDYSTGADITDAIGKVKYVTEVHAPAEERAYYQRSLWNSGYKKRLIYSCNKSSMVVTISTAMREYLVQNGLLHKRVLVIPNAVEKKFLKLSEGGVSIKKSLGLEKRTVVGLVAGMQPFHGVNRIPEIAKNVIKHIGNVTFLLVGPVKTEQLGIFKEFCEQAKDEKMIVSVGVVDYVNVSRYIECMDICIMPDSNTYGSPMKLFEYGIMGKPCVMPAYAPIKEVVTDGENVLLFEPGNFVEMGEKIVRLCRDPEFSNRLAKSLQRKVNLEHTWDRTVTRIVESIRNESIQCSRY